MLKSNFERLNCKPPNIGVLHLRKIVASFFFLLSLFGGECVTNVLAATVPAGFAESSVAGPWSDAVGVSFESNGRMYVWERTGKVWFEDTTDSAPSLLLDI